MSENYTHLVTIVDDDPSVREATANLLKANRFRSKSFSSASEFLQSPLLDQTKCLILDLRLPDMDGLNLQRRLVASHLRVPIIFITAHGSAETREAAMQTGAVDFLPKSFNEDALLAGIHKALGSVKSNAKEGPGGMKTP